MAGGWTEEFNQDVLQTVVDATGAPAPLTASTWWVHLYNSTLNDAASVTTTGESSGDNYTPQKFTNSTGFWTTPAQSSETSVQNKTVVTFTTSASTGWGTAKAFLLSNTSGTTGTAYYWMDLDSNQTISAGNTVQISTGGITLTSRASTD